MFLEGYDIAAIGYAIPSLVDRWGVQPAAFTQTLTAGNVGLLLGSLSAGLLGDRVGRKRVLIISVGVFGLFSLLSALASSPLLLAGLRLLTGLGLGGGIPLAIALASDVAPRGTQGRLVILTNVGAPLGFATSGMAASQFVRTVGWQAIFVVGGLLPLLIVPVLALQLPESPLESAEVRSHNLVAALFQGGYWQTTVLLWVINLLNLLSVYLVLLWTPAILHSAGAVPSQAILGAAMYALGAILSPLLIAPIVDRMGMEIVLTWGLAFGSLCVFAVGLLKPPFWLLALAMCGAGMGGSCQAGINSLSALAYPASIRSTGAGWTSAVGRVGQSWDHSSAEYCWRWAFVLKESLLPLPYQHSLRRC